MRKYLPMGLCMVTRASQIVFNNSSKNSLMSGNTVIYVCFFVRSNISYSLRPDLSIHQLENLCIEIRKPRSKPFLVVTWYRLPDSSVEIFTYFESLIGKIDAENVEFYVLGDLNCNLAAPWTITQIYSLASLMFTACSSSLLIPLVALNHLQL